MDDPYGVMDDPLIVEVDPSSSAPAADDSEAEWSDSDDGINADEPARGALETSEDMMRAAGFVTCPAGCGAWLEPRAEWLTGVPELDRTAPRLSLIHI